MTPMDAVQPPESPAAAWPRLNLDEWEQTYTALHLRTQMVGKTRLALAPMENHWWQVAFYLTARGLGTSSMPCGGRTLDVEFDFLAHQLVLRTSDGEQRALALRAEPLAEFYRRYLAALRELGVEVAIWPVSVEMPEAIPFLDQRQESPYDADAAQRCWRALAQADRLLKRFRGRFLGKCSPVHFWWGGFDLACTRFSGAPAPQHPGGIPHLADWVTREAYSHACASAGWWPGTRGMLDMPAFYAYAYPEPAGYADAAVGPSAAYYHPVLREWILPHDAVRAAPDPDAAVTDFLQSTYAAAATLGSWDRRALERAEARH